MVHPLKKVHPGIVVIGIGNEYRCDDAVGLIVARRLRKSLRTRIPHYFDGRQREVKKHESIKILEFQRDGTSLLHHWQNTDVVILIDAISSGVAAGTIFCKNLLEEHLTDVPFRHSTHSISILDAIEVARTLNALPQKLTFYGIEGKNFSAGTQLSPEVECAIPHLVQDVRQEISAALRMNVERNCYA
jgi:hydrogenase maturation protease